MGKMSTFLFQNNICQDWLAVDSQITNVPILVQKTSQSIKWLALYKVVCLLRMSMIVSNDLFSRPNPFKHSPLPCNDVWPKGFSLYDGEKWWHCGSSPMLPWQIPPCPWQPDNPLWGPSRGRARLIKVPTLHCSWPTTSQRGEQRGEGIT